MIDYSEDWLILLVFKLKGSCMVRACWFAIPSAAVAVFLVNADDWVPDFRKNFGLDDASKSQLWSATTGVLAIMLGFRTNRAMARFWEGTGLLHQMRGEWFDSVSCCVTFSQRAVETKPKEVMSFRHTIVRLMSLCHGSALEEIAGSSGSINTIDSFGLDTKTLQHLKECKDKHGFNRVEVLIHLTQSIITKAHHEGVLNIPPPILSRVYQTISRGFVNLLNAKKIADTRFPFPYAQIITMLLMLHVVLTPIMISCLITHRVMCPVFTFVPIFAMFYINFVGVELENPFGDDDNDLPLDHFQTEMNNCLLMLLQENADHIATIDPKRCTTEFTILKDSLRASTSVHGGEDSQSTMGGIKGYAMKNQRISNFQWNYDVDALDEEDVDAKGFARSLHPSVSMRSEKLNEAQPTSYRASTGISTEQEEKSIPVADPVADMNADNRKAVSSLLAVPDTFSMQQRTAERALEPSLFSGAIDSFLDVRHPICLPVADPGILQAEPIPLSEPDRPVIDLHGKGTRLSAFIPSQAGQIGKGGVAAGAEGLKMDRGIENSMGEFKQALDAWTHLIEGQLAELKQNVGALKRFSDGIPDLLDRSRNQHVAVPVNPQGKG